MKVFFTSFARPTQLLPLLDRQHPPDASPILGGRFQGFAQHMIQLAVEWREVVINNFHHIDYIAKNVVQFSEDNCIDVDKNGNKFRALLLNGQQTVESCLFSALYRLEEYDELSEMKHVVEKCEELKRQIYTQITTHSSVFVSVSSTVTASKWSAAVMEILKILQKLATLKLLHPIHSNLQSMLLRMKSFRDDLDNWIMKKPNNRHVVDDGSFSNLLDKLSVKCLMGVQEGVKKMKCISVEEITWVTSMQVLSSITTALNTSQVKIYFKKVLSVLGLVAGLDNSAKMLVATQDVSSLVVKHLELALATQHELVRASMEFNKFLSVLLNIFKEIAVYGFCPVKEQEDSGTINSDDLKSTEEETSLGQGEGYTDVSDQIDNEDMLDGAYQTPEDATMKKVRKGKEEENGIEMSDNFESKLQDKEDNSEDESDKEDDEKDLEDESGEVDGHEDLDKDMWGDDNEDDKELDDSEEKGKSQEEETENLSAKEDNETSDKEKHKRKEEKNEEQNQ